MSEQKTYRVIRGAIKLPRAHTQDFIANVRKDFVMQGELLPVDVYPEDDIQSWLAGGRIVAAGVSVAQAVEAAEIRASNPFKVDPSTLVGKTMEDLTIMVLEIEPDYDTDALADEQDAVRLLTSGWDPKYIQKIAPVSDRSRPEALVANKLEQTEKETATSSGSTDMSAAAQAGLDAARAKAQAPTETE